MKKKKTDTEGHILYGSLSIKYPEKVNPQGQVAEGWGRGNRIDCLMVIGFSLGVMKMFSTLDRGGGCTMCMSKCH